MYSKHDIKNIYALTPMQRGMLHHALLDAGSYAYHEQLILRLEGELDITLMERSWQQVVDRYDALRGRFLSAQVSNPVHVVPYREPVRLTLHALDKPEYIAGDDGLPAELEAFLACDLAQGFDLEITHPMRLAAFHGSADRYWLVWSFHHMLLDRQSVGIVLDQVLAAYQGGGPANGNGCRYQAYQRWLADRDKSAAVEYWKNTLAGFSGDTLTPPLVARASGRRQATASLDSHATRQLREIAQSHHASIHHLLLAAWALTVGRYLDRQDVLIPTVSAGRPPDIADADRLVGLMVNTIPMRIRWRAGDSFITLLHRVRDHYRQAEAHQYLSLAEMCPSGDKPVIDHVLLVQGLPHRNLAGRRFGDITIGWAGFRECIPYPLEVSLAPFEEAIEITLRSDTVDPAWLQAVGNHLCKSLQVIAADPHRSIAKLDPLDAGQRIALLSWGDGGACRGYRTILEAFDAQLSYMPDAPALICDGTSVSYQELDRMANRLAHALLADGALAPDTPVALVTHRDASLPAGLLAILRAGAAFVAIDPGLHTERIRLMLEASRCRHALTASSLAASIPALSGLRVIPVDQVDPHALVTRPDVCIEPDQLACMTFTSGFTGVPKAVMQRHRNAAAFFGALPYAFGLVPGDRILGAATVSSDIAGLELLGSLCCGMTVVLASEAQASDSSALLELMDREQVNVIQMTPARLQQLLDEANADALPTIRTLLVGGEALSPALAEQLLSMKHMRVFNVYGLAETATWSACWRLAKGPICLGKALPGERLLVLSSQRHLQPPGAIGEIAIAGAGVTRGYLHDNTHTMERFVELHGIDGLVHMTGDLGRWRMDGRLEYLGRRDDLIKIRGTRIDISEIEHQLRHLPGMHDAAAAVRRNQVGEPEIIAYLVLRENIVNWTEAKALLAACLPAAMIPVYCISLQSLPHTPGGKIDRRALPDPDKNENTLPSRIPDNPVEAIITRIFSDILGRPVSPDDHFFLNGGHSLKAIQAIGRINRELACDYSLRDLYVTPTAADLARVRTNRTMPIVRIPDAPDYPLSYTQQALWIQDQMQPGYAGHNMPSAYLLIGKLDIDAFSRAWAALVERHEALRTVFRVSGGLPRQHILHQMRFSIECHTSHMKEGLGGLASSIDEALTARIDELTSRPFDLANGPLFRIALIPLDARRQVLLIVMHHIIMDGWSNVLLSAGLAAAYRAALAGRNPGTALPAVPVLRYRDFAAWQQRYLASPLAQTHREFWRERLRGLPVLELPGDGVRAATLNRCGARVDFRLGTSDSHAWLASVAPDQRLAALASTTLALLHLESRQTDLVLGLSVSNRNRTELQEQVGLHGNALPLRCQVNQEMPLEYLRGECTSAINAALEHADYPFARLVDELELAAGPGRHPVFDVLLAFHQQPMTLPQLEGLDVSPYEQRSCNIRFDLRFEIWLRENELHGFVEYDAGLFSETYADRLIERWQTILNACVQQPRTLLSTLRSDEAFLNNETADLS